MAGGGGSRARSRHLIIQILPKKDFVPGMADFSPHFSDAGVERQIKKKTWKNRGKKHLNHLSFSILPAVHFAKKKPLKRVVYFNIYHSLVIVYLFKKLCVGDILCLALGWALLPCVHCIGLSDF
jgi:hypothetical protein